MEMAVRTRIEWTDATWNPVTGCTKLSPGCKYCYAERLWPRLRHLPAYAGRAFTDIGFHADRFAAPLQWKSPRMVFVNAMGDLFHESVPLDFVADVFRVMAEADQHTFQVLTKRPQRMLEFFASHHRESAPKHVWLGVSVEDQPTADARIPSLLSAPARVLFVSYEPALGAIDLTQVGADKPMVLDALRGVMRSTAPLSLDPSPPEETACIDWVVCGGESGPRARPMHPDWIRHVRDQCRAVGVPFFFKQWGEWCEPGQDFRAPETGDHLIVDAPSPESSEIFDPRTDCLIASDGRVFADPADLPADVRCRLMTRLGKKRAGRQLDGETHDAYPNSEKI